jgi:hypothetical protein
LPLTVSTEKGITAVFAYTSLSQLMAHAAMNCSDKLLEPFFGMPIELEDLQNSAERNLKSITVLDIARSHMADAVEALTTSALAVLVDSGRFVGFLRAEDVLEQVSARMDTKEGLVHLSHVPVKDVWSSKAECEADAVYASDFPMVFASLLQRVLLARTASLAVLADNKAPIGLVTVRNIWEYVMEGSAPRS